MPTNSKFSALFEFATEGILVINNSGNIIMVNPAGGEIVWFCKGRIDKPKD